MSVSIKGPFAQAQESSYSDLNPRCMGFSEGVLRLVVDSLFSVFPGSIDCYLSTVNTQYIMCILMGLD